MKYDFKTLNDRSEKHSMKWESTAKQNPNMTKGIPPFSVADYDLLYPSEMVDGLVNHVRDMVFGYTAPGEKYYNSFINWVERRHGFTYNIDWILDGNGVVASIAHAINAFTKPGDGVIIMAPVYSPFFSTIERNNRKVIVNELINQNNHYSINFEELEKLGKDINNKMLVLCNPHNPVGRVWTKEELIKISDICNANDVLVVSDEIHMDLILFDNKHIVYSSLSEAALNNSIILTSASKSFNLAGTQTSMVIIANDKIRKQFQDYTLRFGHVSINSFGFKLAEIAYNQCEDWFEGLIKLLEQNYNMTVDFINDNELNIKVVPMEGTYLLWLDCTRLNMTDQELYDFLLFDCEFAINRGDSFGEKGSKYIRINIATPSEVLKDALNRLNSKLKAKD